MSVYKSKKRSNERNFHSKRQCLDGVGMCSAILSDLLKGVGGGGGLVSLWIGEVCDIPSLVGLDQTQHSHCGRLQCSCIACVHENLHE